MEGIVVPGATLRWLPLARFPIISLTLDVEHIDIIRLHEEYDNPTLGKQTGVWALMPQRGGLRRESERVWALCSLLHREHYIQKKVTRKIFFNIIGFGLAQFDTCDMTLRWLQAATQTETTVWTAIAAFLFTAFRVTLWGQHYNRMPHMCTWMILRMISRMMRLHGDTSMITCRTTRANL